MATTDPKSARRRAPLGMLGQAPTLPGRSGEGWMLPAGCALLLAALSLLAGWGWYHLPSTPAAACIAAASFLAGCLVPALILHRRDHRRQRDETAILARLAEGLRGLGDHVGLYGPGGETLLAGTGETLPPRREETEDGRWLQIHESETASGDLVRFEADITDLKRTELVLRHAMEQAEKADRSKTSFLAMMSHELRTPLNAVIGFSEIMRTQMLGPIPVRYHEYAKDIHESGLHLLEVINDILDMSKLESGQAVLSEGLCSLPAIVVRCERLVTERAEQENVRIETCFPPDLPNVWADETKLRQTILNLMSNAVKFTRSGGKVTVAIKDLGPDEHEGGMMIEVVDTGIGIAPEDLATAMAPFRQLDNRLDRQYEGTGLGLPLAKGLAELHGAEFRITSTLEVGTIIRIRLPAGRRRPPMAPAYPVSM
ncbi:MAG TPA: ATP-binding protein [Aliidongia sp.]|nr:ATP-binding protein [Aliidongia sp.]